MPQAAPRPPARHMRVATEYDVIALRQAVRQSARDAGLGLTQQARLTAAISAVARGVLTSQDAAAFTIGVAECGSHAAIEVACTLDLAGADVARAGEVCHYAEARALVDEAELRAGERGALLRLRMWLPR